MPDLAPVVEPIAAPAPVVEPITPAAPEAPEAEEAAPEAALPDALIQIPAVQAVFAGTPPAVSVKMKNTGSRQEIKTIVENKDALLEAGMGFYRSLSGELGVMFNALKVSGEDLKAADKQGTLRSLAPDFDLVNHEVSKLGIDHPAFNTAEPVGAPAAPVSAVAPQSAGGQLPLMPPPPAAVQRRLAQQRMKNLTVGAPTSGAAPGAGRILNQILKPVA